MRIMSADELWHAFQRPKHNFAHKVWRTYV